ncbi:hypothetical protein AMAG_14374 [Allomyces macrogynus ATCC 38327]|uniref:Gti1/Pac2 family protein n=1 Tax=Allomyces macrogynus (strain ATCC 38327) TaxID=578462 RepID=A0A0L0T527_ALLM3|nr:hypothetical protein AMAG_14374 [Allomyces macrogynus ATCC 38327]|eukprot:KNE69845.1 hypothetical protein AMAG_14374 [Allomyces macrogynus ATCC 38327]
MVPPASTPSSMSRSAAPRVPPPLPVTYRGYLATFEDALYLLEACRRGVLPRTTKRLSTDEKRRAVFHGAIYLFLEEESGIKRWTDKVDWSASRIAGQFLIYREIHNPAAAAASGAGKDTSAVKDANAATNPAALPATPTSVSTTATPVHCDASDEDEVSLAPSTASSLAVPAKLTTPACAMARKNGFVIKPNGLIKRTISLQCDGATHHIVSYCFPDQVDDLPRPSMDPRLAHLPLPESVQPLLKKSSSGGSSKASQAGGAAGPMSSSSAAGRLRPIACGGSNVATPFASPMMTPDHGTASFADVAAMHDMILHQMHQAAMDASTSPMLAPPWSGPSSVSSPALPSLYGPTSTMPLDSPALMDVDMTMAAATAAALAAASALQGSAPMTPLPDMTPLAPSTATSLLCTPPSASASPTANLWEMIASAPSVSHPPSVGMPPQRSWTGESMSSAAPSLYSPMLGDTMAHAVSCSPTMMAVDSPALEPDFATIVAAAHAAAAAMQHSPAPTTMSSSPGGAQWPDAPQPMHLDTPYPTESGMDDSTAAVIAAAACLARELVALPPPMGSMPATPTATTPPAWHEPASYYPLHGHATTSPPAHQFWHAAPAFAPEQPPFAADGMVGLGIHAPVPVHAPINGGAAAYFGEDVYGRPHPLAPAP